MLGMAQFITFNQVQTKCCKYNQTFLSLNQVQTNVSREKYNNDSFDTVL